MRLFIALLLVPLTTQAEVKDWLPIPGEWKGMQVCQEVSAPEPAPGREILIRISENEVFNEYSTPPEKNSMFAIQDDESGLTADDPKELRSFKGLKVLSPRGNAMLEELASALESPYDGLTYYRLQSLDENPGTTVVRGKMFCDEKNQWCHFRAVKRVPVQGQFFEPEGADMMKVFGDELIRVGYAYDKWGCAPKVCIWVCEDRLKATP